LASNVYQQSAAAPFQNQERPIMTLSSLSAFSISLTFAALALVLGPGEARAEIKCGSTLGPRGAYVLNTDLVCPASADKHGPGILRVVGGATLDLKWPHGDVQQSGLGNPGGCRDPHQQHRARMLARVVAGNAIVRNMTLIDNYGGVEMTGEQSSGANLIVGNIATGGNFGFFVEGRTTTRSSTTKRSATPRPASTSVIHMATP
jgi:hypothetical protein